jgi:hypothetical protein
MGAGTGEPAARWIFGSLSRLAMKAKTPSGAEELGPQDAPGAPGPVPYPDHKIDIPAAPATHPPEPVIVPSESAIFEFWNGYGPAMLLVVFGFLVAVAILIALSS